ncbi:MAG: PilN domain-containing protein [Deltaproteobacteria bacterium]|nr:PilN domain-containing protein [Deltaproteobacteria bacterium]
MIRINLLPIRAEKKRESLRQQALVAAGAVALLGAGILGVHVTLGSDINDLQQRIGERKAEISRLQKVIGEVSVYKKKKRDLEEKIAVISGLEARQRGPSQILREIAQLTPEKMWLESLKDNGGSLSLEGVAIDNQTIAQFMTKLEASPWFEAVRLEVTRQVTRGSANLKAFSIKANVVYAKAG